MKKISLFVLFISLGNILFADKAVIGGVTINWETSENEIEFTLSAQTEGWVALGIEPSSVMKDADIYIGYVDKNGKTVLEDHYGSGRFSHKDDTRLKGENNLTLISGSESNGITTIKFKRPLNSKDKNDYNFVKGKSINVITAIGRKDSFSKHSKTGKGEITIK